MRNKNVERSTMPIRPSDRPPHVSLDAALDHAVAVGEVPYVVAALTDADTTLWTGAAGHARAGVPAAPDTVFRIASMTKAIGATAALILADRGMLDWDTPVADILPPFAQLQVIVPGSQPIRTRPAKTTATLRHLVTHTSGLAYEFWDETVNAVLTERSIPSIVSGQPGSHAYPLAFEPGERWQYGGGVDWLGLVVAAIDGRSIDRFCIEEIFEPLGMMDTVFQLSSEQQQRLGDEFTRRPDGGLEPAPFSLDPPADPDFYGMGAALYSTAADYLRFLRVWLGRGRFGNMRLFSEAAAENALSNQIGDMRIERRSSLFPPVVADFDPLPGAALSQSLIALRVEHDIPGRRRAGSVFWGGVQNTHFWLDPASGRAAVFLTQCIPFLDAKTMQAMTEFERAVYASVP